MAVVIVDPIHIWSLEMAAELGPSLSPEASIWRSNPVLDFAYRGIERAYDHISTDINDITEQIHGAASTLAFQYGDDRPVHIGRSAPDPLFPARPIPEEFTFQGIDKKGTILLTEVIHSDFSTDLVARRDYTFRRAASGRWLGTFNEQPAWGIEKVPRFDVAVRRRKAKQIQATLDDFLARPFTERIHPAA